MTHTTAAETLEKYKDKMGEELGEAFHYCRQKMLDLSTTWDQHETLFQNQGRIDVLNKTGGLLAFNIQRLFYRDVLLGIMRLLDPIETAGRKNLVLELLSQLSNDSCRSKSRTTFLELKSLTKELMAARNKLLAHNDYDVAVKRQAEPNFGSRDLITKCFRLILEFLNIIDLGYTGSRTILLPLGNHDAQLHLHYLEHGLRVTGKILEDLKSGASDWKDFSKPQPWLALGKNEDERYR